MVGKRPLLVGLARHRVYKFRTPVKKKEKRIFSTSEMDKNSEKKKNAKILRKMSAVSNPLDY